MKRIANKGGSGRCKFFRLMKLPIRALSRARDYYISRMVDCGQVPCHSGAHDVGVGLGLPRSFSVARVVDNHRSEDFRELVRVASVRTLARSASVRVGMGKINEEERFSFDGDEDDETRRLRFDDGENGGGAGGRKQSLVVFWRSKSYAVTTKRIAF
ncbi:hypothetical protein QQ045_013441 [Rhodiola kirilowii]